MEIDKNWVKSVIDYKSMASISEVSIVMQQLLQRFEIPHIIYDDRIVVYDAHRDEHRDCKFLAEGGFELDKEYINTYDLISYLSREGDADTAIDNL